MARKQLEQQFDLFNTPQIFGIIKVLLIVAFVSFITWLVVITFNLEKVDWTQAFGSILSLGVAIEVYRQWIAARHEISIDKYYDRIDSVNERMEVLPDANKELMHTFAELDKLEYVLVKYELGYIPPTLALRAILNFKGHCKDLKGFHGRASTWVNKAAYLYITKNVVNTICNDCKDRISSLIISQQSNWGNSNRIRLL